MAKVCTLFSGSSGNSTLISAGGTHMLIDAGVSCKALTGALCAHEIDPVRLQGIFITHEHTDHIKGLRVFLKKYAVPVFGSQKTLEYLIANGHIPPSQTLCAVENHKIALEKMQVQAFATSHDAADSMGYRVETFDERVIALATDLGTVTPEVENGVEGADLVVLEANYEQNLLKSSCYPYYLKQRVASAKGHLSNAESAAFAAKLLKGGTTRVVLAHLSGENNSPSIAHNHVNNSLTMEGYIEGKDFILAVAPRHSSSEIFYL